MMPVMQAPCLNPMRKGSRFEKALAGPTTLAAALVEMVAISNATMPAVTAIFDSKRWTSAMGSHMASPNMTTVALVTARPMNANSAMVAGRPASCPISCERCLQA